MPTVEKVERIIPKADSCLGPAPHIVVTPPGPRARAAVERDQRVTSTSYTRDYPLVVRRGSGSVVEDVDGNRYIDLAAGIAVCATGHCHPKVVEAIQRQAGELIHICGSDYYYEPMIALCEKLAGLVPGNDAQRVFLSNSGTEAVEAAIKLARYATKRKGIIAFHGAFHGRTMGALSLTSSKSRQKLSFAPLIPMVAHAPFGSIDGIVNQIFRQQMVPEEVSCIIVEPIQGEGGYIFPPSDFLPALRELCSRHGILLIADEIQTGMGRTGKMFAFEHAGITPDIICLAKGIASGMPIGALIARDTIMNWPPGAQGSTFGGNPVACAAALATIELIESQYMENAERVGVRLRQHLQGLSERHGSVTRARGVGLMCAIDIVDANGKGDASLRERIIKASFERGLILLPCGEIGIRFVPALSIEQAEIDAGMGVFESAVEASVS